MLAYLKALFAPKFRVTIYLKGGQTVVLRCREFTANSVSNNLKSINYRLDGSPRQLLYTRLDDVSMITSTKA